jgi:hypothetical protein
MKKISTLFVSLFLFSCGTQKSISDGEILLYEILKEDQQNGAKIKFYEIITESSEFKLLLNDVDLKNKIVAKDIVTSNFIILNLGEKTTGGYSIKIKNIEETEESIIVTIEEETPKGMATTVMTYPMMVVKINSKKPIVFN